MNVEDRMKRTLKAMRESNAIDKDKYNAYVYAINCWIEQIERLRKENEKQKNQISELEAELSVKENLLKIKNGLCGEKSDYEKLMEEILSYEPTNKEDDVSLFNYQALRSFCENQYKAKRTPHIHIIGLREFSGEQYMRYSDVQDLIKELES